MENLPDPQPHATPAALHRPMFLWSMPFFFLYFGLPIISKGFGANAAQIGGLFSVFTLTTLLLRPAVGWLIDRLGRKLFFVIAIFIYALAMAVFAFAASMTDLYLARLIQGIGSACLWSAANTIVADLTSPGERGRALGRLSEITTRGSLVGIFAALAVMTYFPQNVGWQYTFLGYSAVTLLAAFLAWKVVPNTRPAIQAVPTRSVISRPMAILLGIVFLTGVPEAMLNPIYLTFLQDKYTTDVVTLAWAFFPASLVTAFLASRLGGFSDRLGRVPMMALGMAGAGIISLFMPGLPSLVWVAVFYTLTTVMWALSEPAETALVADLTGNEKRGFAYSLYDFVENVGFTIGPLLGGLLYDSIGYRMPFYLNGAILILSAILVFVLLGKETRSHPVPQDGNR